MSDEPLGFQLDDVDDDPDDSWTQAPPPPRPTSPIPVTKSSWHSGHSRSRSISVEGITLSNSPPFASTSPSSTGHLLDLKHHLHGTGSAGTSPSSVSYIKLALPPPQPLEIDAHAPWAHTHPDNRPPSPPLFNTSPRLTASHPTIDPGQSSPRKRGSSDPSDPVDVLHHPILTHARRSSAGTHSPRFAPSSPSQSPSPSPPQINGFHLPPPASVPTSTSPSGPAIGMPNGVIALRRRASIESSSRRRAPSPHDRPRSVSPKRSHSAEGTTARRSPQSPEMRISPSTHLSHSFEEIHSTPFKRSSYEDLANAQTNDSPPSPASGLPRPKSAHLAMPPPSGWDLSDDVDESGSDDASGTSGGSDRDEMEEDPSSNSQQEGAEAGQYRVRKFSNEEAGTEEDDEANQPWGPLVEQGGSYGNGPAWAPPSSLTAAPPPAAESSHGGELTMLENIFIYSKSEWKEHRVVVSRSLADWLEEVDICEAMEYVLPLLNSLAGDEDEIKLGLAFTLDRIMWYFYSRCPIAEMHADDEQEGMDVDAAPVLTDTEPDANIKRPHLSAVAFVPLLGLLLMEPTSTIIAAARHALVRFLCRLNGNAPPTDPNVEPSENYGISWGNTAKTTPHDHTEYDFPLEARRRLEYQLLHDVVVGLAHLEPDDDHESQDTAVPMEDVHISGHPPPPLITDSPDPSSDDWGDDNAFTDAQTRQEAGKPIPTEASPDWGEPLARMSNSRGYEKEPSTTEINEATAGKVAALDLCAALALHPESLSEGALESKILPETVRLASDGHPTVRGSAVCALGHLAAVLPEAAVVKQVVPPFEALAIDTIADVKRQACLALIQVCSNLSPDVRRARVLWGVRRFAGDASRSVRIAFATIVGQLFFSLHTVGASIPPELLDAYLGRRLPTTHPPSSPPLADDDKPFAPLATALSSAADLDIASPPLSSSDFLLRISKEPPDQERTAILAYNFPAVALSLGGDRWSDLREMHTDLVHDGDERVRRSVAASMHDVAKIIGPEPAARDVARHYKRYLEDNSTLVRTALLTGTCQLVAALPAQRGREVLSLYLGSIYAVDVPPTKTWREREEAGTGLAYLASQFAGDDLDRSPFYQLWLKLLRDSTAAVRLAAVGACSHIYKELLSNDAQRSRLLAHLLDQFGRATTFRLRSTYVSLLHAIIASGSATPSLIDADILPSLLSLVTDPIVDVRLAIARELSSLARGPYADAPPSKLVEALRKLATDSSSMVRSYVFSEPLLPSSSRSAAPRSPSMEPDEMLDAVNDDELSASAIRDLDDGFGSSPP